LAENVKCRFALYVLGIGLAIISAKAQIITGQTAISGGAGTGSCTNQVVTSLGASPTCTTVTSAYVANSIALTGTDINTSNQVTVTHLAAALPVNQGGTGTTSTLTGLIRGSGTALTAAELSGDVTTSGSNVVTVTKVNGTSFPTSATIVGSNGSAQPITASTTGSGTTVVLATSPTLAGTPTSSTLTINNVNNTWTASTSVFEFNSGTGQDILSSVGANGSTVGSFLIRGVSQGAGAVTNYMSIDTSGNWAYLKENGVAPANSVVCYKAGGVLGYATNTSGVIGTTCN
jgi:hypothetical protein